MAFSETEIKQIEATVGTWVERERPPPHVRAEVDLGFRVSNQSVEIFETRPHWARTNEKMITPVARATYVRTRDQWRILWMRADLKWHRYETIPEADTIDAFLKVVKEDEFACFFG